MNSDQGGPEGIVAGRSDWAWLLQCRDSLNLRFSVKLPSGLTEREVEELLKRLAARDLTPQEVISGSLRKNMKAYLPALQVRREPRKRVVLSIGTSPEYVASQHTPYEFADLEPLMTAPKRPKLTTEE